MKTFVGLRRWALGLAAALSVGAAQAQLSDNAVRIGVMNDMTGLFADLAGPGSVEAARMAVADFGGTVLGRPIEVVGGDHQNKADVGAALARRWYDQDGVDVIMDLPNSGVALAVQQIGREKRRVVIHSSAAASDLTGRACSPYGIQWAFDSYALATGTANALLQRGGSSWFFLTVDYAVGHAFERDVSAVVNARGGRVVGGIRHPLNTADFSSFLLQAQSSRARVLAFANAGGDLSNSIKQAASFGLFRSMTPVGIMVFLTDIHAIGLQDAQGLMLTNSFYWDMNDEARAWSRRFFEKIHRMPTMPQAGVYTATLHYLRAIQAAGTDDPDKVMTQMRATPINDFMTHDGHIREDGRVLRDFYLFQVKKPEESSGPWDYYKLVATVPAEVAARPLNEGGCPLVAR
jgi:branched-chain amino acid transport system substrate-binding protein